MRFIADLHIHSKYSYATSKGMSLESIWEWAQLKGITVIGTGDFTHPRWLRELNKKLESAGNGLFKLKKDFRKDNIPYSCKADIFFMLTTEISCIYTKNRKIRKIHLIILVPNFNCASKISHKLSKICNLNTDGRPLVRIDAKELLKIVLDINPDAMLIPAHMWTPHFSIFSARSGFDSLEECFEELTPHVYAIETGLSSDPSMNWRISALDKLTLISNSDAHSPENIGREANIFNTEISYKKIINALKTRKGFLGTIEFFPQEGKYYYDGHRLCGISLSPEETIKHNYLCPVCRKRITIGVMHRINKLADRKEGFKCESSPSFNFIIPLREIISEVLKVGVNSKTVHREHRTLLKKLGSELKILTDIPLYNFEKASSPGIKEAISRMRLGNVYIKPGYDGKYGKVRIFLKMPQI